MKSSKQLREEIDGLAVKAKAIAEVAASEARDLSTEESTEIDGILGAGDRQGQIDRLKVELARAEKVEAIVASNVGRKAADSFGQDTQAKRITIPAQARKVTSLKAFKSEEDAYASGQAIRAFLGNSNAKQWCQDHGIQVKAAMSEGDNNKGGFLVPSPMENAIVDLRESYGVFRQNVRVVPMTSDTLDIPRRLGGVTAYFVSENAEITASDASVGNAKLVARKLGALTRVSSELSEDALVSIADMLADEMAWAFAVKEDECGFLGDGTSTYGGIVGVKNAVAAGSIATAASATSFGALALTDFHAAVGKLPVYPGMQPAWFIHSAGYHNSMARLQIAAGGNNKVDLGDGPVLQFMGYPVVFSQVLPSTTAAQSGATYAFFGDLRLAASMGSRRGVTVVADSSRYFEFDQIALKATERIDIVVHEVGTSTAAGPVVALKMA